MLAFSVYVNGRPAEKINLNGAYVVGTDDVPLRAEFSFKNGVIQCKKRAAGPAGIALLWDVAGVGRIMVETVRVPERDRPYVLQVELARARLMRIHHKLEDWGLLDFVGIEAIGVKLAESRKALIRALQAESDAEAAALGDESLSLAAQASEALARERADQVLERRRQTGTGRRSLGVTVPLEKSPELIQTKLAGSFDFVNVPLVWRDIEPNEQTFNWKPLDTWVEALTKAQIPVRGSSLLSFNERQVPDWLYIWEHDFDTIRDLAFEHVRRVINRYGQYIQTWNVISGIHANNCFTFNFEQLMELTRMTAVLTKQLSRRGTVVIELTSPWGEYYAWNQRTIPPLLYADMAVQSGVNFDAFGVQLLFGPPPEGMHMRDLFQISSHLDQFAKLGKPIHVTAVHVPSGPTVGGEAPDGGYWGKPWSDDAQAEWLAAFLEIALGKPYIDTVCWKPLADGTPDGSRHAGLLRGDHSNKPAFDQWNAMRQSLQQGGRAVRNNAG
jgi:hypothetical protein